jgi:hypothetical protein
MKWTSGIALALVAILGAGWIYRAELVLFGVAQMKSAVTEVGDTQYRRAGSGGYHFLPGLRRPRELRTLAGRAYVGPLRDALRLRVHPDPTRL